MTTEESTGSRPHTARLDRADIERLGDGSYMLPLALGETGQCIRVRMGAGDAARLHAQLDRLLNEGLAMTEYERTARYGGRYSADLT